MTLITAASSLRHGLFLAACCLTAEIAALAPVPDKIAVDRGRLSDHDVGAAALLLRYFGKNGKLASLVLRNTRAINAGNAASLR